MSRFHNYLEIQINDINYVFRQFENNPSGDIKIISEFSEFLGIELNEDLKLPLITRLVNLREDGLRQALIKESFSDEKIEGILDKAYDFSACYWVNKHKERVELINENEVL